MILSTDTYQRIYEQMNDERDRVLYYLRKNEKKVFKRYRQTRDLPVWYCETIHLPKTHNTYLLYYYAESEMEIRDEACWYGAPLLINDEHGHRMAVLLRTMIERDEKTGKEESYDTLHVYSGHFLSRYRERMRLPDTLSTDELIATYFGRNQGYFASLDYDQFVLEKNRHKCNCAFGIDDGVTFADETILESGVRVLKHNTFLTRKELKGEQVDAMPSLGEMRASALAWELQERMKKFGYDRD